MHEDTPAGGVLLADYFPDLNPAEFFAGLDARGEGMGVRFGPQRLMSNSRLSLEGGEFAREMGLFHEYHEAVFRTYFTDCKDIGDRAVLMAAAGEAGLDVDAFARALDLGTYRDQVIEGTRQARAQGVRAAPTFLIEGYGTIVGAQPFESFRTVLKGLESGGDGVEPLL